MYQTARARLVVGWITLFIMGTDLFVVSPLLPFISHEFGISSTMAGWMVTAFALTYAISAPFFGWLSDNKKKGLFITCGLFLFTFSNVITGLSPSYLWLIISRVLAGLSVASITPLIYAIIGDIAPPNRRGVWLSIVVSGHLMALWLGAPLGTLLEQLVNWRSVFFVMAVVGAALAVANYKTWSSIHQNHSGRNLMQGNLFRILGSISVTTIWGISMYTLYVYLGAALYFENKFSESEIALAITFYGVGAVLGSLTSGQLTNKLGENIVSKVTLILLTLNLIAIGTFFSSDSWLYLLLFMWAFVGYCGFTSYQARLSAEYPKVRGMVMAWNNTALYIGITLGSLIGGYVINNWGYYMLPFVCAGSAAISYILSTQKVKA